MTACFTRRAITLFLAICILCSTIIPVFAEETTTNQTQILDIENGKMFIRETSEKHIAIGADYTTHYVCISIKYLNDPNTVYQWIFEDYSDESFDLDNLSFWEEIIDYAEDNMEEATEVIFTDVETVAGMPMARSSVGADLRPVLESYHGTEHTDKYINTKVMYGKIFHMYEHLYYSIYRERTISWGTALSIASIVVGLLGFAPTTVICSRICTILGIAFTTVDMVIPAGAVNKYVCEAHYHRYVKLDSGSKYALTDLIVSYMAYEDTNLNSTVPASIVPETVSYLYSDSESYFNNGIFDDAYNNYLWAMG